jgi:DNA invertase Pin-like site-specific DNA recombinase
MSSKMIQFYLPVGQGHESRWTRAKAPFNGKIVLYFPRVGKGHNSQRKVAGEFVERNNAKVLSEFFESEPGLLELRKAMAKAKEAGALLVITRLIGTINTNLKFMDAMAECEVDFVAINNKRFNRNTLSKFTTIAQDAWHARREQIKDAMAEKKENGAVFGGARPGHWNKKNRRLMIAATVKAADASVKARRERADAAYAPLMPKMLEMQGEGEGPTAIAEALNMAGHLTTKGMPFTAPTVLKILRRHGGQNDRARAKAVGRKAHLAAAHG